MKKVNALVLGFAVLLAFGCGKDEPAINPIKSLESELGYDKCYLVKETGNGNIYEYFYNSKNQVTRINWKEAITGKLYNFDSLYFDSPGNVVRINRYDGNNNGFCCYFLYDYNADTLLQTVSYYSKINSGGNMILGSRYKFEYNNSKQLIKTFQKPVNQPSVTFSDYSIYTYLPNNEVKREYSLVQNNITTSTTIDTFAFTSIKHPLKHIGYLPGRAVDDAFIIISKFLPIDTEWIYEANPSGYLKKKTSKGINPVTITYEYNCQ